MTDPQNFSAMGDLLKKVMENPELLSGAMNMATALASSGMLNGLFSKNPGATPGSPAPENPSGDTVRTQENPSGAGQAGMPLNGLSGLSGLFNALGGGPTPAAETQSKPQGETAALTPSPSNSTHRAGHKERIALLEAMRPFISPEKKDRLELLIRLLGVMEIVEGMGLGR